MTCLEDPLVVTLIVGSCDICHILVDTRSFVDLLFSSTLHTLGVREEENVKKEMSLVGFSNRTAYTLETIKFPIMAKGSIVMTNFVVVNVPIHYNLIFSKLWIHKIRMVPYAYHHVIKYPTNEGIMDV